MPFLLRRICGKLVRRATSKSRRPTASRDVRRRRGPALGVKARRPRGGMELHGQPGASLGELYTDGRLIVTKGGLYDLLELGARNLAEIEGLPWVKALDRARVAFRGLHQRNDRRRARQQHRPSLRPRCASLRALPRFGPPILLRLFRISRPIARRRADREEAPHRREAFAEGRRDRCSTSAAVSAAWRFISPASPERRSPASHCPRSNSPSQPSAPGRRIRRPRRISAAGLPRCRGNL